MFDEKVEEVLVDSDFVFNLSNTFEEHQVWEIYEIVSGLSTQDDCVFDKLYVPIYPSEDDEEVSGCGL